MEYHHENLRPFIKRIIKKVLIDNGMENGATFLYGLTDIFSISADISDAILCEVGRVEDGSEIEDYEVTHALNWLMANAVFFAIDDPVTPYKFVINDFCLKGKEVA